MELTFVYKINDMKIQLMQKTNAYVNDGFKILTFVAINTGAIQIKNDNILLKIVSAIIQSTRNAVHQKILLWHSKQSGHDPSFHPSAI